MENQSNKDTKKLSNVMKFFYYFFTEEVVEKSKKSSLEIKGIKSTIPRQESTVSTVPYYPKESGIIDPMIKKVEGYQKLFDENIGELSRKYPDSVLIFQEYQIQIDIYREAFNHQMMRDSRQQISCNDYQYQGKYVDTLTWKSLFRTAFSSEIRKTLNYLALFGFKDYPNIEQIRKRFLNSIIKFEKREEILDDVSIDRGSTIQAFQKIRDHWSRPDNSQEMEKLDVVKYLYESIGDRLPACFYWGLVELMLPGTLKDEEYHDEKSRQTDILFERKKFAHVALSMLSVSSLVVTILNQVINNHAYEKKYPWTYVLSYEHDETSGVLHIHMQEPTTPTYTKNAESILSKMFRKGIYALTVYHTDHMLTH